MTVNKYKYYSILIMGLLIYSHQELFAQLEAKNWYFGNYCSIKFENNIPIVVNDSKMKAMFGSATISDKNGKLLFYTNGYTIWSHDHDTMKNGFGLFSSLGTVQGAIIVPMPNNPNLYYLFTVNYGEGAISTRGFWYHIVDISKDSGRGKVILKNQFICSNVTERLSATFHADNKSVWIIVHECNSNKYLAYLLQNTGLNTTPVTSAIGTSHLISSNMHGNTEGQMKLSGSGKRLACVLMGDGIAEVFEFNNASGKLSNCHTIDFYSRENIHTLNANGLEFSPNEKFMYITKTTYPDSGYLYQIDISSNNDILIQSSVFEVYKFKLDINNGGYDISALQIGLDKKIYVSRFYNYLGCIHNPDLKGIACNYEDSSVAVLKPVERGLPTFLQSYFYLPDIEIENTCLGDSTSFNLKDTSNIDSVLWKFGDGDSVIKMFPKHVYTDTGFYQTQAIIFYDNTSDTLEREFRISNYAYPDFTIADTSQCLLGNEFHFYDSSYAVDGSMTYEWDFGDSTASFNQKPTKSYAIADTFPVTLTVTSSYGCESSVSKNVFVRPMPVAEIGVNDSIQCLNENSFSFLNPSASINPLGLKTWYFGDANTSNADTATHHYISADSFEVLLIEETSFGCVDTATKAIVVHPSPVADFKIIDSIQCFNENSFQFTNFSSLPKFGTLEDLSSFNWKFGDQTFSTDTHAVKTYLLADTFGVELVAESADGCKDSVSRQIIVLESPIAAMTVNDSSQCLNGNEFSFSNIPVQADIVGYTWNFGDTTQSQDSNPVKSYLYADTFFISLILSDSFGCKDTAYREVFVRPMPKADFSIDNPYQCLSGNNFNFSNSSNISSGSLNYKWFLNDSLLGLSQHYNNLTIQPPIAIGNSNKIIKLLAESDYHCLDSTEKSIFVNPMPLAGFSYTTPCLEKEISFTDKSQLATGSINNWKWYFTAQDSSTMQNPVFTFTDFEDHSVQLIVQSDSGCLDTLSKTITIYDHAPAVALERVTVVNDQFNLLEWKAPSSPIVSGYRIQKSSNFGNFVDLKTYPKDSLSLSDFSVSPDYSIYTYHILTEDSCGHTSEASNIAQSILLELDSSESFNILSWSAYEEWQSGVERYEVQIFNAQSQSWEKLEAFPFPVAYSDSANKLSQAEYCYRIAAFRTLDDLPSHSNVVCSDTRMNLFVPNAFSPNGDGKNDVFQVRGTYLAAFELKIFNRWGELLFESNSRQNSWDGTFRNKKCPVGVYYFQLKAKGLDGKKVEKTGNVSVLR
jgi:gliding motility-associated-like protein